MTADHVELIANKTKLRIVGRVVRVSDAGCVYVYGAAIGLSNTPGFSPVETQLGIFGMPIIPIAHAQYTDVPIYPPIVGASVYYDEIASDGSTIKFYRYVGDRFDSRAPENASWLRGKAKECMSVDAESLSVFYNDTMLEMQRRLQP